MAQDDDREQRWNNNPLLSMSFSHSGQCLNCIHFFGEVRCEAFPSRIPGAVFDDVIEHDRPLHGDNGTRFEARLLYWLIWGKYNDRW